MASSHDEARASGKHATFHTGFIWAALTEPWEQDCP